jgi:hypothetical protein
LVQLAAPDPVEPVGFVEPAEVDPAGLAGSAELAEPGHLKETQENPTIMQKEKIL